MQYINYEIFMQKNVLSYVKKNNIEIYKMTLQLLCTNAFKLCRKRDNYENDDKDPSLLYDCYKHRRTNNK